MNTQRLTKTGTRLGLLAVAFVLVAGPLVAQKQNRPSNLLRYTQPNDFYEGDGYMVGGEMWETVKPMNTTTANGVEDPLRDRGMLHWITLGPDGGDWREPTGMWPGGYQIVNQWRDGRRMIFPVFEADGWPGYDENNPVRSGDQTDDDRFMFAYYGPNVPGANDPNRNYRREARFADPARLHLVYEAGWPTTAGIDFKVRAHQYTSNEQNLNDFVAVEVSMTNTGVVDTNGDGTPEATDHTIDAVAPLFWGLPSIAVWVGDTGRRRANRFGAGRTFGYVATPDETGAPYAYTVHYANVPPTRSINRSTPAPGTRLIGVNNAATLEGYTDVWSAWTFLGVKQGAIESGTPHGGPGGLDADKETIFGTHPVGDGERRGWYTSQHWQPALFSLNRSDYAFRSATATWYQDYGKTTSGDKPPILNPNPNFFSAGDADDMTTWVVGNPNARPNGDFKYASEDLGKATGITQPVWEEAWNPNVGAGGFYDGAMGWNLEYTFGQEQIQGVGPFGLEVGESITMTFVVAAGFRFEGIDGAVDAARWAWEKNWNIHADMPTPPAPDVNVVSTTEGTALVRWTDVSSVDSDVDGYKVWRASQYKRNEWLDGGFRLMDKYHHLHEPGAYTEAQKDAVNPFFDAEAEFTGETQGIYQPEEWGTYDLIAKIPAGQVDQYRDAAGGYDFALEDPEAITGFTYWYYVSSYKEGSYAGPHGAVPVGHIESSNFNRNGRNGRDAANGEISQETLWQDTYPYARRSPEFPAEGTQRFKNIGAAFTVTPPVAPVDQVADLITVTPNPYKITGLNDVRTNPSSHNIDFLNMPANFTLTILDVSGQIIFQTTVEDAASGKYTWDMFSKDGVEVSSGLYIYHVEYGGDQAVTGHFAILR